MKRLPPIDALEQHERDEQQRMLRDQFRAKIQAVINSAIMCSHCDAMIPNATCTCPPALQFGKCKWDRHINKPIRVVRHDIDGRGIWTTAPNHFVFIGQIRHARQWCHRHGIPFADIRHKKFVSHPTHLRGVALDYYKRLPAFLVWLPQTGLYRADFMEIKDQIQHMVSAGGAVFYTWVDYSRTCAGSPRHPENPFRSTYRSHPGCLTGSGYFSPYSRPQTT